jgi:excinuclease ABC subunit A
MQVDRYKIHDIDIIVDRLVVTEDDSKRLYQSVQQALKIAKGIIRIADKDNNVAYFSKFLMDPVSGISYDEPQPNTFSFNSPYGACEKCNGLGYIFEVDEASVIPNPKLSITNGGLAPIGELPRNVDIPGTEVAGQKIRVQPYNPYRKTNPRAAGYHPERLAGYDKRCR